MDFIFQGDPIQMYSNCNRDQLKSSHPISRNSINSRASSRTSRGPIVYITRPRTEATLDLPVVRAQTETI